MEKSHFRWSTFRGAGQSNPDENPPIGLILCSEHDAAVAHYALGNLGNKVLVREYQLTLPTEEELTRRLKAKRKELDQ